ncbi:MAG: DUF4194 domain-containing protein [Clostridia bacterium]|nr:DUF4194 domain-containing protein [Clostridia bacterium]
MWNQEWERLSDKDKEEFSRIVNLLLSRTFVIREQFDYKIKNLTISRDYRYIERHFSLLNEYLKMAGWHIQADSYLGVMAAYNRFGTNRYRLDKHTTFFLYTLRLIYEEQREKLTLAKHGFTTVGELVEKMFNLGLVEKKPPDTALRGGLSTLKKFQIIDRIEGDWTSPETRIIIYPAIFLVVTNEKISHVYDHLMDEGDEDETIEADALD